MDVSKLRAIIVEDSILKAMDIRKALGFNGIKDVSIVPDQEKLWQEIYQGGEGGEPVGLIVTDMHYPMAAGEAPDEEAGMKLLARMEREGIHIPVIICSSKNYRIPEALGCVWYNKLNDIALDFREVLALLSE